MSARRLALVVCLVGCTTITEGQPLDPGSAGIQAVQDVVAGFSASCLQASRVTLSGTLRTSAGALSFEGLLEQGEPSSFAADFVSPVGNTLATWESTRSTDGQLHAVCSGRCPSMVMTTLQNLSPEDIHGLLCGSPSFATKNTKDPSQWRELAAQGPWQWTGPSTFANTQWRSKVVLDYTPTDLDCRANPSPIRFKKHQITITTRLSRFFWSRVPFTIEWQGVRSCDPQPTFRPQTIRLMAESHATELTIAVHEWSMESPRSALRTSPPSAPQVFFN